MKHRVRCFRCSYFYSNFDVTILFFILVFFVVIIIITGHFSALARLINLLRRAGKLDECSKYLEQVGLVFVVPLA